MRLRRGGRDRGTISIFVALTATPMMLFIGITMDCGGQLRATEQVDARAQEAARIGGQQVDEGALLAGKGYWINTGDALRAAGDYLAPFGLTASWPDPKNPPPDLAPSITIVVNGSYDTALLAIFDTPTLPVRGSATATLADDEKKAGGA
ncbi:hypothetical protein GCM10009665_73870 [Kitasatospora nipponensis]|uniref:Flp pilus-assembly TadE/G-like protein n=1 Tax=Kitasatospora nipponensis TaxID=258049 RepID=A0ABP4DQ86_9ACTN